jgi:hypothetical protein
MSHHRVLLTACAGVAVAAAAAVLPVVVGPPATPLQIVRHVAIGVAWTTAGLVAAWQRPGNRTGPLMVAFGFLWYVGDINFWNAAFPFTVEELLANLYLAVGAHVLVAFPSGRLSSPLERAVVALAYVDALVIANINAPFWDPRQHGCSDCPHNLVLVHASRSIPDAAGLLANIVAAAVAAGIVVVLFERWRGSTPAARRVLAPVLWAGALLAVTQGLYAFENPDTHSLIAVIASVVLTAFPIVVLGALLSVRLHRGAIAQLVIDLGSASSPSAIRAPLAKALGDPSLAVAFWIPAESGYVDAEGHQIELPTSDPRRSVSVLRHEGQPIAALSYDSSLIEEQTFLDAVAAATRLTLENARLQAEVRATRRSARVPRADPRRGRSGTQTTGAQPARRRSTAAARDPARATARARRTRAKQRGNRHANRRSRRRTQRRARGHPRARPWSAPGDPE